MQEADYIIDVGFGAGVHGGNIIASGTHKEIKKVEGSLTAQYLRKEKFIPIPKKRRKKKKSVFVKKAYCNNLKNLDVEFPLSMLTCVTGVSGSGKSTLVNDVLYKLLHTKLFPYTKMHVPRAQIEGIEEIQRVINITQDPIGRTPRSNPATYTGLFMPVRDLFSLLAEAKTRGYKPGRFSFNVAGGRCENCMGSGTICIEMHFLADVYIVCDVCKGKRFNKETLEVKYKGKSIYQVLEMTVETALDFFSDIPNIASKLKTLQEVGLNYIKLGQSAYDLIGWRGTES